MTDQPEALRVAHWLERDGRVNCYEHPLMDAARLLREQHEEIEQLRAQLSLDWEMISEQREEIARLRGALKRIKTLMRELAREALEVKT